MNERTGRWLAVGDVAEIFEWGSRVVKLYKSTAAKPSAFRKVAIQAAVEASGLPVPPSGARKHRNCCLKVHVRALRQRVLVPPSMTNPAPIVVHQDGRDALAAPAESVLVDARSRNHASNPASSRGIAQKLCDAKAMEREDRRQIGPAKGFVGHHGR